MALQIFIKFAYLILGCECMDSESDECDFFHAFTPILCELGQGT